MPGKCWLNFVIDERGSGAASFPTGYLIPDFPRHRRSWRNMDCMTLGPVMQAGIIAGRCGYGRALWRGRKAMLIALTWSNIVKGEGSITREHVIHTRPRRKPTHPGELLREDVLPALRISVSEAARNLRVSRRTLHPILAGNAAVTPEMAVRLGKFCRNEPGLWLRMQQAYDPWHAEQRLADELAKIPTAPAAA
jgi:addiction module HigA family antidote